MGLFDKIDSKAVSGTVPAFTKERIPAILAGMDIGHHVDEDGDVFADWDNLRAHFESGGEQNEILIMRSTWDFRPELAARERLESWVNEWNVSHYWPRVGLVSTDENLVVVTDFILDLETGAADDFIRQQFQCFLSSTFQTYTAIEEAFPEHKEWHNVGA